MKKRKKKKQYTYKHTHSLAHTYSHVWTHTDSDIPAETYRLHKLLLVSHSLRRAQGEEWRQYYLSLSLYKSAGTCTPELGQDCQRLSSGQCVCGEPSTCQGRQMNQCSTSLQEDERVEEKGICVLSTYYVPGLGLGHFPTLSQLVLRSKCIHFFWW